jgi:hypothetical protein
MLTNWKYACEGEIFTQVLQIDPRVVVISWHNGEQNLIAEIPLTASEVRRLQTALQDMKFLTQAPTGQLDDATISAIGLWAEYRMKTPEPYRFARPAVTMNLLDTLKVIE